MSATPRAGAQPRNENGDPDGLLDTEGRQRLARPDPQEHRHDGAGPPARQGRKPAQHQAGLRPADWGAAGREAAGLGSGRRNAAATTASATGCRFSSTEREPRTRDRDGAAGEPGVPPTRGIRRGGPASPRTRGNPMGRGAPAPTTNPTRSGGQKATGAGPREKRNAVA